MNQKELQYFHSDDGRKYNKVLSHRRLRYYLKEQMIQSLIAENHGKEQ